MTDEKFRGPYGDTPLLEKAVKFANWHNDRAHQVFLSEPLRLEDAETKPGQILWLSRAIRCLTREELLTLYDEGMRAVRDDIKAGGDFTPADIRDALPHIYGDPK